MSDQLVILKFFFAFVGSDKKGDLHYMVFGYKYPLDEIAREVVKIDLINSFQYVT